jgi:hypothetical protein
VGVLPLVEWPAYKSEPPNPGDWNGVKSSEVVKVVKDRLLTSTQAGGVVRAGWARVAPASSTLCVWHGSSAQRSARPTPVD